MVNNNYDNNFIQYCSYNYSHQSEHVCVTPWIRQAKLGSSACVCVCVCVGVCVCVCVCVYLVSTVTIKYNNIHNCAAGKGIRHLQSFCIS